MYQDSANDARAALKTATSMLDDGKAANQIAIAQVLATLAQAQAIASLAQEVGNLAKTADDLHKLLTSCVEDGRFRLNTSVWK